MRRILRTAKTVVVMVIVFMMTIDTANACRLIRWIHAHRAAACSSCVPAEVVQEAVPVEAMMSAAPAFMESAPHFSSEEVIVDAGMGGEIVTSEYYGGEIIDNSSACCTAVYSEGGNVEGSYAEDGAAIEGGGAIVSDEVIESSPVDVAPMESVLSPTQDLTPAPAEISDPGPAAENNPLGLDDNAPAGPADDTDADPFPADTDNSPFPADDTPADDPFPASGDTDPFPADEGGEDPFPAGDGDDPFPAGDTPADDEDSNIFGGAAGEPEAQVANDPVAEPNAEDTEGTTDSGNEGETEDDLSIENLFGATHPSPKGMRVWTDDTGSFSTVGRLAVIAKSHVRLLKSNGRYTTVPLTRLSGPDLDYVMAVAVKLTTGTERIASR